MNQRKAARAADNALDVLYARVPSINCKGLCTESCGPIGEATSPRERDRLRERLGTSTMDEPVAFVDRDGSVPCPLLVNGKCSVHDIRPLICRLWGSVEHEMMICPHGCEPARFLTNDQTRELFDRNDQINQRYEGKG
jgi:Fe-S-cluster containining protein